MQRTRILALIALAIVPFLAACSSTSVLAPASATTPYRGSAGEAADDPGNADFGVTPDKSMPITIARPDVDPNHTYTLPELISIAQLANPVTRAAWQRALEAAAAVGVAEGAYVPILSADVLAGYAVTSANAPGVVVPPLINLEPGTVTTSGYQVAPGLAVKWLLFDFGGRDAVLAQTQQLSFAANVNFNLAHQELIYEVARAYFQYSASRAQTRINRESLENAKVVQSAAEARLGQGVATTMEVSQAKQVVAQAKFDLTQAEGTERATYQELLAAMGISPTTKLKVADIAKRPLPRAVPADLETLITDSLQRRPDVQAAFARVKANKQGIAAAEAEFLPKVALTGTVNRTYGSYEVNDSRFPGSTTLDTNQPNAALLIGLSFPIYDGGMRKSRLEAAEAQAAAAEQEFTELQNRAAQEIVTAYDVLRTALSGSAAASELVRAARTNNEAALDYYKNGLGTLSEISITQTGLLKALFAEAQARSSVFGAAATLAFATGQLTSANAP